MAETDDNVLQVWWEGQQELAKQDSICARAQRLRKHGPFEELQCYGVTTGKDVWGRPSVGRKPGPSLQPHGIFLVAAGKVEKAEAGAPVKRPGKK